VARRLDPSLRAFLSRFLVALMICVLLAAGGVAGAYWFANDKWDAVANADIPDDAFAHTVKGKPANFLIIGSDTRAFVKNSTDAEHFGTESEEGGQRSDTIMVAHIDPDTNRGMLVSFPRDLKVNVPGRGYTRINSAFNDGPAKVIQTLKDNFNIPIHHYLEVDFAGFRELVDAVGGVPIYFTTPARDKFTGLRILLPGCYTLNGGNALAYVRSRHYEFKESSTDDWHEDPYSDLGRIARQQYFIRSLAEVAINTAAKHPLKANNILNKAFASLTKDRNLGLSDVKGLAATLRETDPAVVQMITLPNKPSGDGATLVTDDAKAAPVLAELRSFGANPATSSTLPKNVKPGDVTVKVLNGSGVSGAAAGTLDALGQAGFQRVDPPADADRTDYATTEVRYAPGAKDKALLVAAYLGGAGKLVAGGNVVGSDVTIVLGRDFTQVTPPTTAAATTAPSTAATTTTSPSGPKPNPGQVAGIGPQPPVGCG
jgi:LCP family protein required for cell wall assembly